MHISIPSITGLTQTLRPLRKSWRTLRLNLLPQRTQSEKIRKERRDNTSINYKAA